MKQPIRETNIVQATTSSVESMGELLLQGYCMLADGCSDCMVPLMRDPQGTKDICVNCGKSFPVLSRYSRDGTEQAIEKSQQEVVQDTSVLLAERMIKGWKMLADHCPICQTTLLESKIEGKYCVSCDMPVRRTDGSKMERMIKSAGGEQTVSHYAIQDQNTQNLTILELKRNLVTRILDYMDTIARSLKHSPNGVEQSSLSMNPDQIISRLLECANIVSKVDGITL